MNEVEFLLRRILKVGYEFAQEEYDQRSGTPAIALHRYTSQMRLLAHLEENFLERKTIVKQD
jgi:hypothetical protein